MTPGDARTALSRQLARARSALAAERAALAALPVALVALVWAAAALAGLPDLIGPLGMSLAAIGALFVLFLFALRRARTWRRPTENEARARLERDSALDPGTLASLEDKPTRLEPFALALWRKAQADAYGRAASARARGPRFRFDAVDRYGARYVAIALVIGAALLAQEDWSRRLTAAFVPDPGPLVGDKPIAIEAWAAPAPYTGAAPVSLTDRLGERVETPPQVEVTIRVSGPVGAPTLRFAGQGGARALTLSPTPDGAWEGRLALPGAGVVTLRRFGEKARWRIEPAPDQAPTARFLEPPSLDAEALYAALRVRWAAQDDFGVRSIALRLTPIDPPPGLKGAAPADVALEPPGAEPREAEGETSIDLTAHAYAGMEVEARFVARDALGQEGLSAPVRIALPAPILNQPLAQAAMEIRREILHERRAYAPLRRPRSPPATFPAADAILGVRELVLRTDDYAPRLERAPPGVKRAARMLDALTIAPEDGYFADLAVLLGLESARATLGEAASLADADAAADLLWHVAQRAEFGDSADARTALERAQRALSAAIERGAPPEEIARLSEAVREAMQDYITALMQEALREGRVDQREETRDQAALSRSDLDALMQEVERLAREGRTEEAQALLRQLTQMLATMEVRLTAGGGGEEQGDARSQELEEAIRGLSEATGEQRDLRDDTQRAEQGEAGGEGDRLADRQSGLQRRLDEVRRRAGANAGEDGEGGGAAQALDEAGEAMAEAEQALRQGDLSAAQQAQDEALRRLRAGSEALSQEMLARQAQEREGGRSGAGAERDPLGRPIGAGLGDGDDVGVPQEMERQRAREIRDELRRRAQDPSRPERERAYLRRLLERFTGS